MKRVMSLSDIKYTPYHSLFPLVRKRSLNRKALTNNRSKSLYYTNKKVLYKIIYEYVEPAKE
jgi:hypothetical protein